MGGVKNLTTRPLPATTDSRQVELAFHVTSLLEDSTPFLLAYSVPLLLLSAIVTFAGTFLTFDRTRAFAPRSDAIPALPGLYTGTEKSSNNQKGRKFRLGGGVGGLAIGYVFGLHASTFLSLLIMNESNSSPLSTSTFLVVWLFSIIPTTILGGRWKIVALVFLGVTGGITISLGLRSSSNLAHTTARIATSCTGALSMTMAIALLTRSTASYSWANIWDRLWVANGAGWGTARERGFDTLFCALWAGGGIADWGLRRWIGEDPDETSFFWWDRLLAKLHLSSSSPARPLDILFPSDADLAFKPPYASIPGTPFDEKPAAYLSKEDLQRAVSPAAYNWDPPSPAKGAGFLRKNQHRGLGFKKVVHHDTSDLGSETDRFNLARSPTCLQKTKGARAHRRPQNAVGKGRRAAVQFRPKDGFSSDSEEEPSSEDELKTPLTTPRKGASVRASPMNSVEFLDGMDIEEEKARLAELKITFGNSDRGRTPLPPHTAPEYSDVEEDVTVAHARSAGSPPPNAPGWKPEFIKRAASSSSSSAASSAQKYRAAGTVLPPRAVPMTPSIVHAIGRLAKAQAAVYGDELQSGRLAEATAPPADLSAPHQYPPLPRREHVAVAMDARAPVPGLPVTRDGQQAPGADDAGKWDDFWRDIQMKAAEAER
ncbi:hypothetical protein DFH11DRAFT_1842299 [Phellopilus nigrolimitatus]|nr:hypothetical protein DFH11DRAFT_1842299 [Phellopilus nigrolimitatus]